MSVKAPEKLLADRLKADAAVAAILGDRIFPVIAPASSAIPFATWRRQSVQREQTLSGPLGMPIVTWGLDIYAETYQAVRDAADACRACLDGWTGAVGNYVSVRLVTLINEGDGFVQLAGGELPPIYSVTQTYQILWGPEQ